ncbi:MAG: hypothetical protein GY711_25805 [bacterium]|nr:hypothetical protein [bacterium]
MQDVPAMVSRIDLEFRDYLDSRIAAVTDAEHCVRLNYETYFFGNLWTRERFLSDPVLYCGLLTDPVTRQRFRPNERSPRARHEDVTYYFETKAGRDEFKAGPESFRLPGWSM